MAYLSQVDGCQNHTNLSSHSNFIYYNAKILTPRGTASHSCLKSQRNFPHWVSPKHIFTSSIAAQCTPHSRDACEAAALALGLSVGGAGSDFEGNWSTKGCYTYKKGTYTGHVYYGKGDGPISNKLTGDIYRPKGYDCATGNRNVTENIRSVLILWDSTCIVGRPIVMFWSGWGQKSNNRCCWDIYEAHLSL